MGAFTIPGSEDVKSLTDVIKEEGLDFAVGPRVVEGTLYDFLDK